MGESFIEESKLKCLKVLSRKIIHHLFRNKINFGNVLNASEQKLMDLITLKNILLLLDKKCIIGNIESGDIAYD